MFISTETELTLAQNLVISISRHILRLSYLSFKKGHWVLEYLDWNSSRIWEKKDQTMKKMHSGYLDI